MTFLLTRFIKPLSEPIYLSKYHNLRFDNPRTPEELKAVEELLKGAWTASDKLEGSEYKRLPLAKEVAEKEDLITFDYVINRYFEKYYPKAKAAILRNKFDGSKKSVIEFYARNWVVLRIDNQAMLDEEMALQEAAKELRSTDNKASLIILEDDHIFSQREELTLGYSRIFSLLAVAQAKDVDYSWNFLLTEHLDDLEYYNPHVRIMESILFNSLFIGSKDVNPSGYQFDNLINAIMDTVDILDERLFEGRLDENILQYVGHLLSSVRLETNDYYALTQAVSILELLLTHKPSSTRFNVEDSITKQFILKTAIAFEAKNPGIDLGDTKENLKNIYQQRSNIVHGNFEATAKYEKTLKQSEKYFGSLVASAYCFVANVIELYIDRPEYVYFLKDN